LPLPGIEEGALALIDVQVIVRRGADDLVQRGAARHQLGEGGEPGLAAAALLALLAGLAGIHAQPVGVALQRRALTLGADGRPGTLVGLLLWGDLVALLQGRDVEDRLLPAALLRRPRILARSVVALDHQLRGVVLPGRGPLLGRGLLRHRVPVERRLVL